MPRTKGSKNKSEEEKAKEKTKGTQEKRREKLLRLFRANPEKALKIFETFLNIARGKVDIKYRLRLLLEPDNIKTTTRLTHSQVDFVSLCFFMADKFKDEGFGGLADFATEFCLTNISLHGLGREEAIAYEGAIGEGKLLSRLNIFGSAESKPGKPGGKN